MKNGKGQYDRRGPITVPFTEEEESDIEFLVARIELPSLYKGLTVHQTKPRYQRLIQEAIERKRASG